MLKLCLSNKSEQKLTAKKLEPTVLHAALTRGSSFILTPRVDLIPVLVHNYEAGQRPEEQCQGQKVIN